MGKMRYARIFHQILDSSVADCWEARVVLQDLIMLADEDGVVDVTVNALHRRTNLPLEVVEKGLERLLEPDPLSRSAKEGGRRLVLLDPGRAWGWKIVNYKHYDRLRSKEDKREADRERVAEKRAAEKAAAVGLEALPVDPQLSLDVAECREVSQSVASRRGKSQVSPPLAPNLNPNQKKTPCSPPRGTTAKSEIEWRIGETWSAHCEARRAHFEKRHGRRTAEPTLTAEIRKAVSRSLREHDAHLLGPDQRDRWTKESKTRAAGLGIFFSSWHTGDAKGTDRPYLEPWRPWKRQRGKPDPVENFAELFFHPPRAPPRNPHAAGSGPSLPTTRRVELPPRDPTRAEDWEKLLAQLGSRLDPDEIKIWLGPAELWGSKERRLMVALPNEHFVHTVEQIFGDPIREGCKALAIAGVDFVAKETACDK